MTFKINWHPWNKNKPQVLHKNSKYYGKSEICFSGFPKMVCQGTHILERYRWKILKLWQINGLILGLTPVVFPHLANFVNPRNSSAAVSQCIVVLLTTLFPTQVSLAWTYTFSWNLILLSPKGINSTTDTFSWNIPDLINLWPP